MYKNVIGGVSTKVRCTVEGWWWNLGVAISAQSAPARMHNEGVIFYKRLNFNPLNRRLLQKDKKWWMVYKYRLLNKEVKHNDSQLRYATVRHSVTQLRPLFPGQNLPVGNTVNLPLVSISGPQKIFGQCANGLIVKKCSARLVLSMCSVWHKCKHKDAVVQRTSLRCVQLARPQVATLAPGTPLQNVPKMRAGLKNPGNFSALAKQVATNAPVYNPQNRKLKNLRWCLKAGLRKPPRSHGHWVAEWYLPTPCDFPCDQVSDYTVRSSWPTRAQTTHRSKCALCPRFLESMFLENDTPQKATKRKPCTPKNDSRFFVILGKIDRYRNMKGPKNIVENREQQVGRKQKQEIGHCLKT